MAIDRQFIGFRLPSFSTTVSTDTLRRFAAAIGLQGDGRDDAHVPPTFLKVIEGEGNSSRAILAALGVDLTRVLHAEQEFEYHAAYHGGDPLSVERVVSDIYARKGGQLEFIVVDSEIRHAAGELVARTQQVILVRNPPSEAPA